ncbi:MAG TPA: hypothetical protein VM598_14445 [Bdellovibrionota bacterium]|nr:hypothetical protein [Bdellovibrionota bacterium]
MVWKPKEKELTLEEAIEQARRELSPFWLGCAPMLAANRGEDGKLSVFPLTKEFSEVPRVFLFVDPTQPGSEYLLQFGREWGRRYQAHGCGFLAALRTPYSVASQAPEFQEFARRTSLGFPIVLDRDGLLADALAGPKLPAVVLLHEGKTVFVATNWTEPEAIELKLQEYFRRKDPGLPLRPPYRRDATVPSETISLELGLGRGHAFPAPKFRPGTGGFHAARFEGEVRAEKLPPGTFQIRGSWLQDGDRILTSDPESAISFHASRANVAIVAQCVSKISGHGRITVELEGRPIFEIFAGSALQMEEDGQSRVQVGALQLYPILRALPPESRSVCLRFTGAKEFPLAIHGLRFWN